MGAARLSAEGPPWGSIVAVVAGGFLLYILFIVGHLVGVQGRKFGSFVIFLGLAFGMAGFVAKFIIQWDMETLRGFFPSFRTGSVTTMKSGPIRV